MRNYPWYKCFQQVCLSVQGVLSNLSIIVNFLFFCGLFKIYVKTGIEMIANESVYHTRCFASQTMKKKVESLYYNLRCPRLVKKSLHKTFTYLTGFGAYVIRMYQ